MSGRRYNLILLMLLIPTLTLSVLAAGSDTLPGDVAVMRFVQNVVPSALSGVVDTMNLIGTTAGHVLITAAISAAIFLSGHTVPALLIVATLPLKFLNGFLKWIFESPRPPDTVVQVTEYASGFGFPSGHTMGATVLYGALFAIAPHITSKPASCMMIRVGSLAMILLAGLSRIVTGAHWPSDVIGAYLWGTTLLFFSALAVRWLGWLSRAS